MDIPIHTVLIIVVGSINSADVKQRFYTLELCARADPWKSIASACGIIAYPSSRIYYSSDTTRTRHHHHHHHRSLSRNKRSAPPRRNYANLFSRIPEASRVILSHINFSPGSRLYILYNRGDDDGALRCIYIYIFPVHISATVSYAVYICLGIYIKGQERSFFRTIYRCDLWGISID